MTQYIDPQKNHVPTLPASKESQTDNYEPRFYRDWTGRHHKQPLKRFNITQDESDLDLYVTDHVEGAAEVLTDCRKILIAHIEKEPEFKDSLVPIPIEPNDPPMIQRMKDAALQAEVGPMAAVAGIVAEIVGTQLAKKNPDVIVENGGDLYLSLSTTRRVLIYAGTSPLSNCLALVINPEDTPLGICTSSGTFGHSLSFGKADAVVILSPDAALADAVATATANRIQTKTDLQEAVQYASKISGILGVVAIKEDSLAVWGDLKLKKVSP